MDAGDLQQALGAIVMESSYLEQVLRAAFAALTGSEYAAAVDARMTAHELIEVCENLVRAHTDLGATASAELKAALGACDRANQKRNRAIHDAWTFRPDGVLVSVTPAAREVSSTVPGLREMAAQIGAAAEALGAATLAAFGPDSLRAGDQLGPEPGGDTGADPG
jgi:hypothetical protein